MTEDRTDAPDRALTRREALQGGGAVAGAALLSKFTVAGSAAAQSTQEPRLQLGEDYVFDDRDGDLVLEHTPTGAQFTYDESAGQWTFGSVATGEIRIADDVTAGGTGGDVQDLVDTFSGSGHLQLPGGEWVFSQPLSLPDQVTLSTISRGATTFKQADGANISGGIIESPGTGASHATVYRANVFGLTIDGNTANNTSGSGIYGNFYDDHLMWNTIKNCPDRCIHIIDPNDGGAEAVNHKILFNRLRDAGVDGLFMAKATDGMISHNIIHGNASRGIRINVGWGQQIIGNHTYANDAGSMTFDGQHRTFVLGNFCNPSGGASQGLRFRAVSGTNCEKNVIGFNNIIGPTQGLAMQDTGSENCNNFAVGFNVFDGCTTAIASASSNAENDYWANVTPGTSTLISNEGTRAVIDGWGQNAGDPSSTGDWNGNGREGVAVVDTTNNVHYVYRGGAWV